MKLRQIAILFIFLFSSLLSEGQENSVLYENGTLKADSNFHLKENELKLWFEIEEETISNFVNHFETPQIIIDANISFIGIASFQFDKKTKKYLLTLDSNSYIKNETMNDLLKEAIESAINKDISWQTKSYLLKEYKSETTFYLPIKVKVQDSKKFVNQKGQIILEKSSKPLVKPDKIKSH
jgi:hypothetical protein